MTRVLFCSLLAVALAGCPSTVPGGAGIPDDDDATANDDDATANDDDATADDDDATADDDDVGADDDDSAPDEDGDDDDSAPPIEDLCDAEVLLGTPCSPTSWRSLSIDLGCPVGPYAASDAAGWADLLTQCGVVTDPLPAHDWSLESVVGFVDAGSGCDADAEVLWAVECGGRVHIGEAFAACGECAAVPSAGAWAAIPAGSLPLDSRVRCVPEELACD